MRVGKSLISLLLICSYTTGFCHSFLPACGEFHVAHTHASDSAHQEHDHDNHHHHSSTESINNEHSHIVHNDHYDDNLLDFLICTLKESKHHHGPCDLQDATIIHEFAGIEKQADKSFSLIGFVPSDFHLTGRPARTFITTSSISTQSKEFLQHNSLRGPPLHS
ncbi:MAG: hypothetical protein ACI837_002062 [Crocinitomicaceae bacterium]|jgi:hypothetical protein